MPRKKNKDLEPVEVKPPKEIRDEIRAYIKADQSTLLKKQMSLKEAIKSEDSRRLQFIERKLKMETKSLPINILKLIGSLKKAVRYTMRYKGGTPFSIIRDLFVYWDADKSGEMSASELLSCMNSLGVIISLKECDEVVKFYNGGQAESEMQYSELLKDIQEGEPTLIEYVSEADEKAASQNEIHFEQFQESFREMPPVVNKFLEAVREWVQKLLRDVGGTPVEHIRFLFKFYDFDYSGGLYAEEIIIAAKRSIKLKISKEQANQIVKYYDRKNLSQIHYETFLADVCVHVKPVLTFTELTPRRIENAKKSLQKNPFIPRPFAAPPNKILEKFKKDCQLALVNKVNKLGGSIPSWVRDAFIFWDPGYTRRISTVDALLGAAKRIGIVLSLSDAKVLMKCYDRFDTGEMHYDFLSEDLTKEAPNFLMDNKPNLTLPLSHRTPPMVQKTLDRLKRSCEALVRQSKGVLQGRDLLHGTFVRFDNTKCGQIDAASFKMAVADLRCKCPDSDLMATMKWFDTNGSLMLDYNALCRQMFGEDISTETLVLPRIKDTKKFDNIATMMNSVSYGSSIGEKPFAYTIPTEGKGKGFGVKSSTAEKNMDVVESEAVKLARLKLKRNKILTEKKKVEKKLHSIEEQRKQVIENFKETRHAKKTV